MGTATTYSNYNYVVIHRHSTGSQQPAHSPTGAATAISRGTRAGYPQVQVRNNLPCGKAGPLTKAALSLSRHAFRKPARVSRRTHSRGRAATSELGTRPRLGLPVRVGPRNTVFCEEGVTRCGEIAVSESHRTKLLERARNASSRRFSCHTTSPGSRSPRIAPRVYLCLPSNSPIFLTPPVEVDPEVLTTDVREAHLRLRNLKTELEDAHPTERLPWVCRESVPEIDRPLRLAKSHPRAH
ncbi:MAG: hypothetical protein JWQ68_757 [Cryobacterium sp.]|jgi:hypothetical protein|nr:hypothetical protein [Cryobacterium sp.]